MFEDLPHYMPSGTAMKRRTERHFGCAKAFIFMIFHHINLCYARQTPPKNAVGQAVYTAVHTTVWTGLGQVPARLVRYTTVRQTNLLLSFDREPP
jgi:hypothetical protein